MAELNYDDDIEDDDDVDVLSDIEEEKEIDKSFSTYPTEDSPSNNNNTTNTTTTTNPFGQPIINNDPWNTNNNNVSQTIFPSFLGNSWQTFNNNNQQNTNPWFNSNNNNQPWGSSVSASGRKELPRNKKIIFIDLLDNVIESWYACGKQCVPIRGIYDIKIRFDVLDRLGAIRPEYIFIVTNQNITPNTVQSSVFEAMTEWLVFAIAEYLRMPYKNVRCYIKAGFNSKDTYVKPNTGLLKLALKGIPDYKRFTKSDMLVLGSASGLSGQSNRDIIMARKFGVDYIDIQQMLTCYY